MDRRSFFKHGAKRLGEELGRAIAEASPPVMRAVRPPFARPEDEFQALCTRCDACIEACPHGVVFALDAEFGASMENTPALNLSQVACRLCEDWPCVEACEVDALALPTLAKEQAAPPPRLAQAQIRQTDCLPWQGPECGACADSCPIPGALQWQGPRPSINAEHCVGCALCREACIANPNAVELTPLGKK